MSGSFKDLLQKAGLQTGELADASADVPAGGAPALEDRVVYGPKIVVRYQRKGHGGRQVTRISGVSSGHERLLEDLKQELGCGGRVDDEDVLIQGHQTERVARWLESRGAKKVIRS